MLLGMMGYATVPGHLVFYADFKHVDRSWNHGSEEVFCQEV